jgi:hypothetical protein
MKPLWQTVVLALCVALGMARPGAAVGESPEQTLSPYFLVENGDPAIDQLPLAETKAQVHIAEVIADVLVSQVFDRFYSLARPDTGRKSTGLGLNFVREVARSHGGTIRVENRVANQPERGAIAELVLPWQGQPPA